MTFWLPDQHDQRCPARQGGECVNETTCKECGQHVAPDCKKCGSRLGPEYHELAGTYLDQTKLFFRDCGVCGQQITRSVNAWR